MLLIRYVPVPLVAAQLGHLQTMGDGDLREGVTVARASSLKVRRSIVRIHTSLQCVNIQFIGAVYRNWSMALILPHSM